MKRQTPIQIIILLILMLLSELFIIYCSISYIQFNHATVSTPEIAPFNRQDLLNGINGYREQFGFAALTLSPLLNQSAQLHVNDMDSKQYFEHNSPSGQTPWAWFNQVGYNYTTAGENIAKCYPDDSAALSAWWASPEHKANILGDFKETGFGFGRYTPTCVVIVEHFGSIK